MLKPACKSSLTCMQVSRLLLTRHSRQQTAKLLVAEILARRDKFWPLPQFVTGLQGARLGLWPCHV